MDIYYPTLPLLRPAPERWAPLAGLATRQRLCFPKQVQYSAWIIEKEIGCGPPASRFADHVPVSNVIRQLGLTKVAVTPGEPTLKRLVSTSASTATVARPAPSPTASSTIR